MTHPSYPVSEVVVVIDPHPGPFMRQLSTVTPSKHLPLLVKEEVEKLQALGWVDRVVLADAAGSAEVEVNRGQAWLIDL